MPYDLIRRRTVLAGLGGTILASSLPLGRTARAASSAVVGFIYVGPRDDFGYNQSHAAGRCRAQENAGGQGRRRRERIPETVDVAEDDGKHDQPRRCRAAVPDLVRLFRSLHPQSGGAVSEGHLRALRRALDRQGPEECRQLLRLHLRGAIINGVVAGYMSKSGKLGFVAAKPIPQVLQNINAFTLGAPARQSECLDQADLHRRLVAARQRSRSDQQPGRSGHRCCDHACRQPQGSGADRERSAER